MITETQLDKIYNKVIKHSNDQSEKTQEPTLSLIKDYLELINNVSNTTSN